MTPKQHPSSDPNSAASKATQDSTGNTSEALPGDLEAAWTVWGAAIQRVDERTRNLLRAAFEAGHESGRAAGRTEFAQTVGRRGGRARLSTMTGQERSDAAKAAAFARWSSHKPLDPTRE